MPKVILSLRITKTCRSNGNTLSDGFIVAVKHIARLCSICFEKNFAPFRTAFPESAGKILAAVAASGNDLDALESKVLQYAFDTAAGKPDLLVKSWITIRSASGELFYEAAAVYSFEKNTDFESDTLIIDF